MGRCRGGGYDIFETASSSSETLDSRQTGPPEEEEDPPPSRQKRDSTEPAYQWTLNSWRRRNSGSVRVDLASPEDVTLDSDSTRVVFSAYGTTV